MRLMQAESSPLDRLEEATSALQREDLMGLPDEALGEDLIGLRRGIDRLEAEFMRRLRHFDHTQAYSPSGALSAAAWLRWKCRLAGSTAADRVRVARRLEELPQTSQAFAEGEINLQQVAVITRTVGRSARGRPGTPNRSSWKRRRPLTQPSCARSQATSATASTPTAAWSSTSTTRSGGACTSARPGMDCSSSTASSTLRAGPCCRRL
jgi:hypothetical protein